MCSTQPLHECTSPLPLAGEVDALGERGGWGLSPHGTEFVEAAPPQPSPASGRGSAVPSGMQFDLMSQDDSILRAIPQLVTLDLSGGRLRKRIHRFDPARIFPDTD